MGILCCGSPFVVFVEHFLKSYTFLLAYVYHNATRNKHSHLLLLKISISASHRGASWKKSVCGIWKRKSYRSLKPPGSFNVVPVRHRHFVNFFRGVGGCLTSIKMWSAIPVGTEHVTILSTVGWWKETDIALYLIDHYIWYSIISYIPLYLIFHYICYSIISDIPLYLIFHYIWYSIISDIPL